MSLTKEKLLLPRIKVISLWPGAECKVGDIIIPPDKNWMYNKYEYCEANYFDSWPALFVRLPWYAEREESDLPKYLKSIRNEVNVVKVGEYKLEFGCFSIENLEFPESLNLFIPSSLEEYNQFINQKEKS